MSTPTSYYDWLARNHGASTPDGVYEYVFYDYYAGDEIQFNNVIFKDSRYVTLDNTHVRALNKTDIHMYDTSDIKIFDSGSLTMYTSATTVSAGITLVIPTTSFEVTATSVDTILDDILLLYTATTATETDVFVNTISTTSVTTSADLDLYMNTLYESPTAVQITASLTAVSGVTDTNAVTAVSGLWIRDEYETPTKDFARMFVVDNKGRVGIGLAHENPHGSPHDTPVYDLDVRGTVGINSFIYHNADAETYMLFGATSATQYVSLSGEPDLTGPTETGQITFCVSGVETLVLTPSGLKLGDNTLMDQDITLLRSYDHISTTVGEYSAVWMANTSESVTDLTTTVRDNSASWAGETDTQPLQDDIDEITTVVQTNSTAWAEQTDTTQLQLDVNSNTDNITSLENTTGQHTIDINNITNTVQANSATTWSQPGLYSRTTASVTTTSLADGASDNVSVVAAKSYLLQKIETSAAAWVTLYTDSNARTVDASRNQTTDPVPGGGVLAEIITTAATTQLITPGTIGFNNDSPATDNIYLKVVNQSGATTPVTVTLTYVQLEA